ncbi:MAG: acetylglutamate kinase, partial [Lachnospiraceae bacterium]|nr:acetylglutamate kinase [Lachnospiraceae bacterium]
NEVVFKAETLIEALPYIQKFKDKIVVVKYGGSAMLDPELKMNVIKDCALLKFVGMHPVIVHGGGKEISKWVGLLGHEPKFIEGLRVTDAETMEVAEMVLSKVNKSLVTMLEQIGVKAAGISGKDGGMLSCEKKYANGQDIGFVGNVTNVKTDIITTLIENDYIPVIAPIGMDVSGNSYNINADDAACAVASALKAEKLAFLTDIEGVYKDKDDPSSLLSVLTLTEAEQLIGDGYVGGGMIPKLKNCIESVKSGVSRVHIIDGRSPHCLLLEFFTDKGIGTAIIKDETVKQ